MSTTNLIRGLAFIAVVGLLTVYSLIGCRFTGQNKTKTVPNCNETFCDYTPDVSIGNEVQRLEISRNSNYFAQIDVPVEVEAIVHFPDYREPYKVKILLTKGTWLLPESMNSIKQMENKTRTKGTPKKLAGM